MLVNNCILGHFQVYNASMHEHAQSFDFGNSEGFGLVLVVLYLCKALW